MKRQYLAKILIASAIGTSLLMSCQSTGSLDMIRELENLKGKERIEAYAEEIGRNPQPELLYNLSFHQMEEKDYKGAISTAKRALDENPEYLRMRFILLISYRELGYGNAYGKTLEDIAREIPYDREIIELLLDHYQEERRYDEMVKAARQLLKLDPESEKAMSALSYESEYMKRLSGYFELDKVIETLPEIETSSRFREDELMDRIRERYLLPFLF